VVQAPLDRGAIHPRRTEVGLGLLVLLGDPGIGTLVRLEVAEGIGDPVTVDRLHLGAPQHGCEQGERHGQTHLLHRRLLGFAVEAAGARGSGSAASRTWATRASRWPPSRRRGGAAPKWRARRSATVSSSVSIGSRGSHESSALAREASAYQKCRDISTDTGSG